MADIVGGAVSAVVGGILGGLFFGNLESRRAKKRRAELRGEGLYECSVRATEGGILATTWQPGTARIGAGQMSFNGRTFAIYSLDVNSRRSTSVHEGWNQLDPGREIFGFNTLTARYELALHPEDVDEVIDALSTLTRE